MKVSSMALVVVLCTGSLLLCQATENTTSIVLVKKKGASKIVGDISAVDVKAKTIQLKTSTGVNTLSLANDVEIVEKNKVVSLGDISLPAHVVVICKKVARTKVVTHITILGENADKNHADMQPSVK